MIILIA